MKTLAILMLFASMTFAGAQSAEWIAHKTGNTVKQTKEFLAAGFVYDASDNSLAMPNAVGRPIPRHNGARYIYYIADNIYQFEDENGEIRFFRSHLCRYNPRTHTSQFQLPNGRWIEP
jgi:hypothetical protein